MHINRRFKDAFKARLREQERNDDMLGISPHRTEEIGYIAMETGQGRIGDKVYEVGLTPREVNHKWYTILFNQTFESVPEFLAQKSTEQGDNPSSLRLRILDSDGVDVFVEEEQSLDQEIEHAKEQVGYLAIEPAGLIEVGQPDSGTVKSAQKISDTEGNFSGRLQNGGDFGAAVSSLGDLDRDGVPDLAVSVATDPGEGVGVWVLFMNADGTVKSERKISSTPGGLGSDLPENTVIVRPIAGLGDLDGDGVVDLAVGAPLATGDDGVRFSGAVWILFLRQDGTIKSEQTISSTSGGFGGVIRRGGFGGSIFSLGDLDGDGVMDLAASETRESSGDIWILFMNRDGTVKAEQMISDTSYGFMGLNAFQNVVANVGDVDGDGVTDLAVGRNFVDEGDVLGAVWILFLRNDGTIKANKKISASEASLSEGKQRDFARFGSAISPLGDLDDDGVVDLAVGSKTDGDGGINRGAVWVLFLKRDGSVKSFQKISDILGGFQGELSDRDWFGCSVADIGDLDGDGRPELAVGAPNDNDGQSFGSRGAVWILSLF